MPASSPAVASSRSTLKPRRSAQRIIMRSTISAQSWASVPPAPALTVTSASPASYLPLNRRSSSSAARRVSTDANASSSSEARSGSSSASSTRPSRSSASVWSLVNASSRRWVRVCSALVLAAVSGSSQKPGAPIRASSALRRACSEAGSKVVREQGHLLADAGQPLRGGLGGGGGGHGCEASGRSAGLRWTGHGASLPARPATRDASAGRSPRDRAGRSSAAGDRGAADGADGRGRPARRRDPRGDRPRRRAGGRLDEGARPDRSRPALARRGGRLDPLARGGDEDARGGGRAAAGDGREARADLRPPDRKARLGTTQSVASAAANARASGVAPAAGSKA